MTSRLLVALVVVTGSAACGNAPLDRATLHGTAEHGHTVRDVPVLGFQVLVVTSGGTVKGELLAVGTNALWVQTDARDTVTILLESVQKVRVYVHDSYGGAYGGWTAAGGASALTHGWWFVFTGPVWGLVGGLTAGSETGLGRAYAMPGDFDALRQYARFPQGPPSILSGESDPTSPLAPPAFVPTPESLRYAPRPTAPIAPPIAPSATPPPTPDLRPTVPEVPVDPPPPLPEIPPAPLWYELPVQAPPAT